MNPIKTNSEIHNCTVTSLNVLICKIETQSKSAFVFWFCIRAWRGRDESGCVMRAVTRSSRGTGLMLFAGLLWCSSAGLVVEINRGGGWQGGAEGRTSSGPDALMVHCAAWCRSILMMGNMRALLWKSWAEPVDVKAPSCTDLPLFVLWYTAVLSHSLLSDCVQTWLDDWVFYFLQISNLFSIVLSPNHRTFQPTRGPLITSSGSFAAVKTQTSDRGFDWSTDCRLVFSERLLIQLFVGQTPQKCCKPQTTEAHPVSRSRLSSLSRQG